MINMKQTKKKAVMTIGLALGVTVFASAALASYNTSNGYEVGKNAIKGLLNNENYTMNVNVKMSIDGNEIASTDITELYDRNGDVSLNRSEKSTTSKEYEYYMGASEYKSYKQDGDYISTYYFDDGEANTSIYKGSDYMGNGSCDVMNDADEDEKETTNKVIRFVELIGDTVVGDLKNNIVYVSGDDDRATYEISLDTMQIPEVVNAGLSAVFSSMNQYDNEDPFMMFGTDPIIKNASLKFTVDNEGRATDAVAVAVMSGNGHEGKIELSLKMSDYGTTKPERVDVSTLPNVETYDISEDGMHSYSIGSDDSETEIHITENGEAVNTDGENVGHIEIDQNSGEGTVVYND